MKKILTTFVIALFIGLTASPASAKAAKMLFWYPGEAGSTADAQPILDEFSAFINAKIAPDAVTAKYFNSLQGGLEYFLRERPAVAIISYSTFAQFTEKLGITTAWLAVRPAPSGQTTEAYSLYGSAAANSMPENIISSEPISADFARMALFPNLPVGSKLTQVPQILFALKKISEGQMNAAAILTPTEAATLSKLSAPWIKNLKEIARSNPVPTARVVLIDPSWTGAAKLRSALLSLDTDPEAQEMLSELRLKGFAEIK